MNVVVCDDDASLRSVVSRLATEAGHYVLAETDNAADATDLVIRFHIEILILDLSLPWGSGMNAIRDLKARGSDCQVLVFTSYAGDVPEVFDSGVRAVVEKPDFEKLEGILAELALEEASTTGAERRRVTMTRRRFPPVGSLSASGLEETSTFEAATQALGEGDAALVVHVGSREVSDDWQVELVAADRLLSVARLLRMGLRAPDRLSVVEPTRGGVPDELIVLLLNGHHLGVRSLWRRLCTMHDDEGLPGVLSAGWAVFDGRGSPLYTIERARVAAHRSVGQHPDERLWAG